MSDEFVWICRRDLQNGQNITVRVLQQAAVGYQTDWAKFCKSLLQSCPTSGCWYFLYYNFPISLFQFSILHIFPPFPSKFNAMRLVIVILKRLWVMYGDGKPCMYCVSNLHKSIVMNRYYDQLLKYSISVFLIWYLINISLKLSKV